MNKIILIGNGFDLAHGLKTSYADFIKWYWNEWGMRLLRASTYEESDEFCSFESNLKVEGHRLTWFQLQQCHYIEKEDFFRPGDGNKIVKQIRSKEYCQFKYKSPFFKQINNSIETKGWVDIENEYYSILVEEKAFGNHYFTLNKQLDFLREKLIEYLTQESQMKTSIIEGIKEKLYCPIQLKEIEIARQKEFVLSDCSTSSIMLLNFNYTNTLLRYIEDSSNVVLNYIHGHIEKPQSVIFGYGDELDGNYNRLKEQNNNECLRHMKSINYLESDNYRKMLEFIESAPFQVCIMGHSCGRSDRTLLNTLFEHRNCVSIKPYYHQKSDGTDNYIELVQNISRNFTDMKLMRDRVVNKTYTEPLT